MLTQNDALFVLAVGALVGAAYFMFASFIFGAGYQPAPRAVVTRMLDDAQVASTDRLVDLGAGTGAIVFRAARERGARAVAVEIDPFRIGILRLRRRFGRAGDRVEIRWGDMFRLDLRAADVVAVFLWPGAMLRLRSVFETQLKAGSRVVSHWHPVPGWKAHSYDETTRVYLYRWPEARPDPSPSAG
ncbi:MAG: SAM-dependent methyltransferase [Thermoplasmata archaeon]|nr:SAM-dependent methyltransferase [Thermoplasmata archaeon]